VDWNGVLEVEHGLFPVGRRVLGTSAERQGVALHIKYNIKVANESLAWLEEERNEFSLSVMLSSIAYTTLVIDLGLHGSWQKFLFATFRLYSDNLLHISIIL